jgi:peptidoglycan/LPS O-acetylase OafA/YrhL
VSTILGAIHGLDFLVFNGPLWSLSYEVWLYALAGLVTYSLVTGEGWWVAALCAFFMFAVSDATPAIWSIGAVWGLGFAYGTASRSCLLRFEAAKPLVALGCVLVCLIVGNIDILVIWGSPYSEFRGQLFYVAFSMLLLCGMTGFLITRRFESKILVRVLAWFSTFSYTLYLIHFPVFMLSLSLLRPLVLSSGMIGMIFISIFSIAAVILLSWGMAKICEDRSAMRTLALKLALHFSVLTQSFKKAKTPS